MLEKALRGLGGELLDHVGEDAAHGVETRGGGADVAQANVVEEYLGGA